jgi:REP element-mobilizing transposase RayT
MTYLITFSCYGCHMHGHDAGSVDRNHRMPGSRLLGADPRRVLVEQRRMDQPPYALDQDRRAIVLESLREVCRFRQWILHAAHVRSAHVHAVVEAEDRPERVMNDFKAYASRLLNHAKLDDPDRRRWTRHGSTRWLWDEESVSAAIRYVVDGQGEAMAVFEA